MTLFLYRLFSSKVQLRYVLGRGTYLARRREQERSISLYYLTDKGRGFFVEVGVSELTHTAVVVRSFGTSKPLEKYACQVRLPEL